MKINELKSRSNNLLSLSLTILLAVLYATLDAQPPVTVGILTDCQYAPGNNTGERYYAASLAKLDSSIRFFNRKQVQAVIHLGDVIDHGFSNYDSVLPHFQLSNAPVYYVLGNHEFAVDSSHKKRVISRLGLTRPYYSTLIDNWQFIILNGNDLSYRAPQNEQQLREADSLSYVLSSQHRCNGSWWNGGISREQMEWLKETLSEAGKAGRKVIVMSHFPVYPATCFNLWNDSELISVMRQYPCVKAYCCGHRHEGDYASLHGIHFINFRGMVETEHNAFTLMTLTDDSILLQGFGRETSRRLPVRNDAQDTAIVYRGNPYVVIPPGTTEPETMKITTTVTPSPRQLAWQKREFTAFLHFGLNTFTNKEWSEGKDPPELFNPTAYDPEQWIRILRNAGVSMVILTAKHHDGFCLWPSVNTDYSVKSSTWKEGRGDVVADVARFCQKYGMKLGIYLSPWDRHESRYGDSPSYNEYFGKQLTELLTQYGDIAEVWFDGACGEGPNGRKQVYDWNSYYNIIRQLQPDAVIAVMGPDVRWVGTESGYGRDTEWSVLPGSLMNLDTIAGISQQVSLDEGFTPKDLTSVDLGSRDKIRRSNSLVWYPAEADVSIRPGWFYHPSEDDKVKSPEKLVDIYFNAVGRNAVLLLNVPPDDRGLIHENDSASLMKMKEILDNTFEANLAENARCVTNNPAEDTTKSLQYEYTLESAKTFDVLLLQEDITQGQRIEQFHADAWDGGEWKEIARGTTVGYKRLLRFGENTASKIRLTIDQYRAQPLLLPIGLYLLPSCLKHTAKAKYRIRLSTTYSPKYAAGGLEATVDSLRGSRFFDDGRWQGYEGNDFDAVIDLGGRQLVNSISTGFLQDQKSWIFMPQQVDYQFSINGVDYQQAGIVVNTLSDTINKAATKDFNLSLSPTPARFIRILAKNRGVCPEWHMGKGEKSWIFVDEIRVNED